MQLIVLGSSGSYPGPGKACSGYLVIERDTRLLLDCGTGVLANLQKHIAIEDITGIIISHMHPDHFLDLVPLRYALKYGGLNTRVPLPVYLPLGGLDIWERIVAPFDESKGAFSAPFVLSEYEQSQIYSIGCFKVQYTQLQHYIPDYGIEITCGGRLVYTGDSGPNSELLKWAKQADLFLCEASLANDTAHAEVRGHLTAKEASSIAREAGVHQLILTHLMPGVNACKILETAKLDFGDRVSIAEEGQVYQIL